VDAVEGPMPQTRFVLKKALELGHRVVVVVNKVDRPASRPDFVVNMTFELFVELEASDEQVSTISIDVFFCHGFCPSFSRRGIFQNYHH
jgi:predicted membrane GTPase involved in stress response